jgi:hypothetical protein
MATKKGTTPRRKAPDEKRAMVLVSPALLKQLKLYAVEHETSVKEVAEGVLSRFLGKATNRRVRNSPLTLSEARR